MLWIDISIILTYLIGISVMTWVISRRQKNKNDYLMAGRKMHWFPVALSGVAAGFSSISLLAVPGFVYATDLRYLPSLFVGFLSIPVVFFFIVPFLYKLSLVSVYEFLEHRFCSEIRYSASILFIFSKLAYLAMVIYTSALVLSSITGIQITYLILLVGLLTTIYTVASGLEGVIWTDLVQYFIIVIGLGGLMLFFTCSIGTENLKEYWNLAVAAGKTKTFDFSFDLKSLSVWGLAINGTLLGIAGVCTDQSAVQRLCSARSLKDSMKSYIFSIAFGIPIVLVLYLIGIYLYGFFNLTETLPADIASVPDKVFPYFISHMLPVGLGGLLLAAIFAAGMSSINTAQHSLTTLFMVDFYERLFKKDANIKHYVHTSRVTSFCFGLLAVIGAFYVMLLGKTLIEVTQIVSAILFAPLGGCFFLGIFTKKANSTGTVTGVTAGVLVTFGAWYLNYAKIIPISFVWFGVFGVISTVVIGYCISIVTGGNKLSDSAPKTV